MFSLKAAAGESSDFPAFYAAHERRVRATLFYLVGRDDLDDLAQQVFLRCWSARAQFGGRSQESTWVTRVAVNLAKDHWRSRSRSPVVVDEGQAAEIPDGNSAEAARRLEDREAIERAMQRLSFDHRSVIALMYFQELSLEEIAEATGEPVGTVKSRLHYARGELRRILTEMGIEVDS